MTIIYHGYPFSAEQARANRLDREDRAMYAQALTWLSLVGTIEQRIERAYNRMMWQAEVDAQAADHADLADTQRCAQ